MTNLAENFSMFHHKRTSLEQTHDVDKARADLKEIANEAGTKMQTAFASGNTALGMYLASTASELAGAAQTISKQSNHTNKTPSSNIEGDSVRPTRGLGRG